MTIINLNTIIQLITVKRKKLKRNVLRKKKFNLFSMCNNSCKFGNSEDKIGTQNDYIIKHGNFIHFFKQNFAAINKI